VTVKQWGVALAGFALLVPVAATPPASAASPTAALSDAATATPRAGVKVVLRAPVVTADARPTLVRFTWTRGANSAVTGVKWEVDVVSDPGSTAIVSRQAYAVAGEPGEIIAVRVRAVRGIRKGPWSQTVRAEIPAPVPPTPSPVPSPSGVIVTALAPTQATIAWQGSTTVDRFDVFLNGVKATSAYPPNLSATLPGLTAGVAYSVQVQAIQGVRSSTLSDAVSFTTPLSAPVGLSVSSVTSTGASISWQPVSGATSYDVLLNGAVVGSGVTSNTYTFSGLTSGTSYTAGVRARYSSSSVSGTSTLSFVTSADASQVPVNTALPTVSVTTYIAPAPGVALTATAGTWTSSGALTYTYQWQRSLDDSIYTDISGATSSSFTARQADLGYYLRARVTATNANGSAVRASLGTAKVVAFAPSQALSAQGYAVTENILTLGAVTWSVNPPPTLSVTWEKSSDESTWTSLSSSSPSVTLDDTLVNQYVRAKVVATSTAGSVTYFTASRGPVASALNIAAPMLMGTGAIVGDFLCTTTGSWIPNVATLDDTDFSWQRYDPVQGVWSVISGQTSMCYAPTSADLGFYLRSVVSATNTSASAAPVIAYSSQVGPVLANDPNTLANTSTPIVTGVPSTTTTLTTTAGTWTPATGVTFSYQWQRSLDDSTWSNIAGATGATYAPLVGDLNYHMRSTVTGIYAGQSLTAVSASTVKVGTPYASAVPTVTGTARAPLTLTMSSAGTWVNTPTSYTYQWQASADGLVWSDIGGATGTTVTLGINEIADLVRLKVTATNAVGSTVAYSNVVGPIAPPVNTMAPQVTGTTTSTSTLSVSTGDWSGVAGLTYYYQWEYSEDGGATWQFDGGSASTYTPGSSRVGDLVRCEVFLYYSVYVPGSSAFVTSSAYSNVVGPITP